MKLNWNIKKTLWALTIIEFIIIILLLVQRGPKVQPNITDTKFQDSLIHENNRLKDSINNNIKQYDLLDTRYNNRINQLMDSFTLRNDRLKKEREIIYERIKNINRFTNSELARAFAEFR